MRLILQTKWSRFLIPIVFLFSYAGFVDAASASYSPNPTADTEWPYSAETAVADIQTRFNNARSNENTQLGISLPMMTLPSQEEWNLKSDGEKALWLINREREDRGVAPLHGIEVNVTGVAQYYAEYLMVNDAFNHDADGNFPWERLDTNPAINACHDFLSVSENLAVLWGGWTLPLERAVYMWIYDDSGSSWGHRHAIMWYPYNDNSGPIGREGFLGIGHAIGTHQSWSHADIFVMNIFDPCSTWIYPPVAGDVNGDGDVDLADVITVLQMLADIDGISASITGNVDGDDRIGLVEAVFGLQKVALMR